MSLGIDRVASLSRGLTLFLDPKSRETTLKQSHGLQAWDWVKELSSGLSEVGNLRTRLTKGLFGDLLASTKNRFYFRHNSSAVNWSVGAHIPPTSAEFTLKEIAARIPDVSGQYSVWSGTEFPFVTMQSFQVDRENGIYKYAVPSRDANKVDSVFPSSRFPSRSLVSDGSQVLVECSMAEDTFFAQRVGAFNIGEVVLYEPLDSKHYFSPLAACFMLSFVLGMLCRYFPTTWISIGRTEKGDSFYPLATRLLDWIEETFPAMVVDVLRGPYAFERQ